MRPALFTKNWRTLKAIAERMKGSHFQNYQHWSAFNYLIIKVLCRSAIQQQSQSSQGCGVHAPYSILLAPWVVVGNKQ
jgi:hypothetical protein